jgi:hypothetical protein
MKYLTGVLLLSTMISSSFAAEVFNQTFSCQNGKSLTLSLDIAKNLPAPTITKNYCSFDERGETCDSAYSVESALFATWRITSTIPGFKAKAKTFPIDLMIFPVSGMNSITLVTDLGIHLPEIKVSKNRHLTVAVGANFSYKAEAILSESNELTDLVNLDEVNVGGGVIQYESNGDFKVLCSF